MHWFAKEYNFFRYDYWFGQIDSRPLSLFRLCFAALLLKDALYHIPLASWFYSDTGITPRLALLDGLARSNRFSFMDALPHDWMAISFFVLWVGVLLCLMLGYRTRLMSILNFVIILSVHERNIYLLNGADTVFRLLSFWTIFLPLGHYYSIDALRERKSLTRDSHALAEQPLAPRMAYIFPVRMIQLQIAIVYLFAALMKLESDIWKSGEALHYVWQLKSFTLPTANWLLTAAPTWLLYFMTHSALLIEAAFILLVFAPFAQPFLRLTGLTLGALLHLGIAITMSIPNFSLVMLVSYLFFFEPRWILALHHRLSKSRLLHALLHPLAIIRGHPWARMISCCASICAPPPPERAERCTSMVTRRRRLGKLTQALMTIFLALTMVSVIWWNLRTYKRNGEPVVSPVPNWSRRLVQYTGLWQGWNIFAPDPKRVEGWIVIPGEFEDGTSFDLRTGKAVTNEIPRRFWGPAIRWRKYDDRVGRREYKPLLRAWGKYYCRQYNILATSSPRLATLEIHYISRWSHEPGGTPNPLQERHLWKHSCPEE